MKNIYLIIATALLTFNVFALSGNPVLNIYTDNVENRFEVGSMANIFVELMTDIEMPNGESEIEMDGVIVGFPSIPLEMTKISKTLYLYTSPILTITDVGERYFQVQMKVRSKKTADRIKAAIQANIAKIDETIILLNSTSDEELRAGYQREIDRLTTSNVSLSQKLASLFAPLGPAKELGIRIVPNLNDAVDVLVSKEELNIGVGLNGQYSIHLASQPISDVIIMVNSEYNDININETSESRFELLFTAENFSRPQEIKISLKQNVPLPNNFEIYHEVYSRDPRYNRGVVENVKVRVLSDE